MTRQQKLVTMCSAWVALMGATGGVTTAMAASGATPPAICYESTYSDGPFAPLEGCYYTSEGCSLVGELWNAMWEACSDGFDAAAVNCSGVAGWDGELPPIGWDMSPVCTEEDSYHCDGTATYIVGCQFYWLGSE